MSEPLINADRVEEIAVDCLPVDKGPDDIKIEGIIHEYWFVPAKLEEHRVEVTEMLASLPIQFRPIEVGGGGGWSFLQACQDANDEQWTGLHWRMEQLFCLGIALGLCEWLLPREMWNAFPGSMPYVSVKV